MKLSFAIVETNPEGSLHSTIAAHRDKYPRPTVGGTLTPDQFTEQDLAVFMTSMRQQGITDEEYLNMYRKIFTHGFKRSIQVLKNNGR